MGCAARRGFLHLEQIGFAQVVHALALQVCGAARKPRTIQRVTGPLLHKARPAPRLPGDGYPPDAMRRATSCAAMLRRRSPPKASSPYISISGRKSFSAICSRAARAESGGAVHRPRVWRFVRPRPRAKHRWGHGRALQGSAPVCLPPTTACCAPLPEAITNGSPTASAHHFVGVDAPQTSPIDLAVGLAERERGHALGTVQACAQRCRSERADTVLSQSLAGKQERQPLPFTRLP
jgi:hypothetical protein